MHPTRAAARRVGLLYLVFSVLAIVREFLFPEFYVVGDAAATAGKIAAAEPVYRLGLLMSFGNLVLFLFLVVSLYHLFRDVDRKLAALMVVLVSVGVALSLANLLNHLAPLVLLSGADYLAVFSKPQLDALVQGFLRLEGLGSALPLGFWGLWLFPFGLLVIKSGYFPRILGLLLMVAGFAYVVSSGTAIALPAYRQVVSRFMMPLYIGEVPIIFWLLIRGADVPQPPATRSA